MSAFAVLAHPDPYGCDGVERPDTANSKFVLLVARNHCTFTEKVLNAQRAGYDAAIVYSTDSDDLIEMSADAKESEEVHIPAMYIGARSESLIAQYYLYDKHDVNYFTMVLNRELPFNINTKLIIPFAVVVGFSFVFMVGLGIAKCVRHRRRMARELLPRRDLSKLPVIRYNSAQRYETCAICLDEYIDGERLRVLPCDHTYHTKCIDPWLTKGKRNCPMCKRKVRFTARRSRRRTTATSSGSGSSSSDNDRTPLLNPVRNNNNGTFEEAPGVAPPPPLPIRLNAPRPLPPLPPHLGRSNPFDRPSPQPNDRISTISSTTDRPEQRESMAVRMLRRLG